MATALGALVDSAGWWGDRPRWQKGAISLAAIVIVLAVIAEASSPSDNADPDDELTAAVVASQPTTSVATTQPVTSVTTVLATTSPISTTTTSAATTTTTSTTTAPTTTSTTTSTTTAPTTTTTTAPTTTTSTTTPPTTTIPQPILVSVTDGDTFVVDRGGVEEPVRLIGINAPEGGECFADEATARLSALLGEGILTMSADVSNRDQFDRLLRYVYVGDVFVNEVLVREGLAVAQRYEPDTTQAGPLEAAQTTAENEGVGLWAADACGTAARAQVEIGEIRYDADGNDNFNLNDEWVEFDNTGTSPIDLTGWGVKDETASHRYTFPSGYTVPPGGTVRLHTGCGTDTADALYWCESGSAVWNNSGDTVFLLDPNGNIAVSETY